MVKTGASLIGYPFAVHPFNTIHTFTPAELERMNSTILEHGDHINLVTNLFIPHACLRENCGVPVVHLTRYDAHYNPARCHSCEGRNPESSFSITCYLIIINNISTTSSRYFWTPAFAGVTQLLSSSILGQPPSRE